MYESVSVLLYYSILLKHLFRLLYGEFKRQEGSGPPPLRVNGVSKRDRKGLDVAVDGWEDLAQEGKTLPRMGRPCPGWEDLA